MSIPAWDSLHPLVVHFPIALLMVAPLFALLALVFPKAGRVLGASALLLMVLGTAATFLAFATGEAAEERAEGIPQAEAILESHEETAAITRMVFTALTLVYAVILLLPLALKRDLPRAPSTVVGIAFLLLYAGGGVLLANVGHQGARLVHQYGVHAAIGDSVFSTPVVSREHKHKEHEDHE